MASVNRCPLILIIFAGISLQPCITLRVGNATDPADKEAWWIPHQFAAYARSPGFQSQIDLEHIKPLVLIHVPKTGSPFFRSLGSIPGMCDNTTDTWYGEFGLRTDCHVNETYAGRVHLGFDDATYTKIVKGHGFIMLREPDTRLISNWKYFGPIDRNIDTPDGKPAKNITEYAEADQGCAVKLLTRPGKVCGRFPVPTTDEVSLAKQRLRDGFVFVGITDQWEMTMCLLHAMFGYHCEAGDFGWDLIPTMSNRTGQHNMSLLNGFHDKYDTELYREAEKIFNERLRAYDLSPSACKPCFAEAGIQFDKTH